MTKNMMMLTFGINIFKLFWQNLRKYLRISGQNLRDLHQNQRKLNQKVFWIESSN
jgi:hypothetical protein